ncbi:hypothetical protein EYC84_004280 [Monilinia fructicola]|uniref:Uncharacterized protein n=1 Tax=Monilinia fructicola TaxID=38448 RepID=A0A5M9K4W1_MONFR|nr:hypothetical protein EYC84_004280 [Monilinia fructicola]
MVETFSLLSPGTTQRFVFDSVLRCHKKNQLIQSLTFLSRNSVPSSLLKIYPYQPECTLTPSSLYTISIYPQSKPPLLLGHLS